MNDAKTLGAGAGDPGAETVFAPDAGEFPLDRDDMRAACVGACVLASGGGGSYQVAKQIIELGVPENARVTAVAQTSLPPEAWATVAANMGSPGALFRTANPHAPTNATKALAEWCESQPAGSRFAGFRGFAAVVPVEVGAINTASPLAAAAQLDLLVVDADGAGRSIPTLPLTAFARNVPLFPNVVASESPRGSRFNTGQVRVDGEAEAEEAIIGMVMTPPFGGIAGLAIYALQGKDLARTPLVRGTLRDALEIGRRVLASTGRDRAEAVVRYLTMERPDGPRLARIVFSGRVTAMTQAQGGTDIGSIVLRGTAPGAAGPLDLWIYNQNENIFCQRSDQTTPLVMGPDSLCYVPAEGEVFDNSDLWNLYQKDAASIPEVFVVAIDAAAAVKSNRPLLDAWTPERAQFGYAGPYVQPWRT